MDKRYFFVLLLFFVLFSTNQVIIWFFLTQLDDHGIRQRDTKNLLPQQSRSLSKNSSVHFVYAVGCGGQSSYKYQFIQCLTLENSFFEKQKYGTLTRLVTGCTTDKKKQDYLKRTVTADKIKLDRLEILFTEKFETLPSGKKYVMFNRPNGLLKLFRGELNSRFIDKSRDDIFIVLDPDFIFLTQFPLSDVKQNKNFAGYYHMGSSWIGWMRTFCDRVLTKQWKPFETVPGAINEENFYDLITTSNCERVNSLQRKQGKLHYEGGAPYVMRRRQWLKLLPVWLVMIPIIHNNFYDSIESDMYAWMFASHFTNIEHNIKDNYMRTCMWPENHKDIHTDEIFIHYCQRYHVLENTYKVNDAAEFLSSHELQIAGEFKHTFTFSKYWLQARGSQQWISECSSPLLISPPIDAIAPTAKMENHMQIIKTLVSSINNALTAFKLTYCNVEQVNLNKRVILHEAHKINHHLLNSIV